MEVEFEDYYLDFPDDAQDDEIVGFLSDLGDDIKTFFVGDPYADLRESYYDEASRQWVKPQAPLVTEELTRSWEPYIIGGAARDFVIGSELLAHNLAGQRADAPEDIAGAMAATGVTGAATQFPAKTTPGTVRSFIGQYGARNAGDAEALNKKVQAGIKAKQGLSREEIFDETGWWQDMDGKWRFEEPNAKFMINESPIEKLFNKLDPTKTYEPVEYKLKELLPADDPIMKYYGDELGEYTVRIQYDSDLPRVKGRFYQDEKVLELEGNNPLEMKSAILHEAQHAIQQKEGMSGGASYRNFYAPHTTVDDIRDPKSVGQIVDMVGYKWDATDSPTTNLERLRDALAMKIPKKDRSEAGQAVIDNLQKEIDNLLKIEDSRPTSVFRYYNNLGEIDARNVQARAYGSDKYPWETEALTTKGLRHTDVQDFDPKGKGAYQRYLDMGAPEDATEIFPEYYGDISEVYTNPKARL